VAIVEPSRTTRTFPVSMRNRPLPTSPCRAMVRPAGTSTSVAIARIAARCSSVIPENRRIARSLSSRASPPMVMRTSPSWPAIVTRAHGRVKPPCEQGPRRPRGRASSREPRRPCGRLRA
jgi:hypothetical protein